MNHNIAQKRSVLANGAEHRLRVAKHMSCSLTKLASLKISITPAKLLRQLLTITELYAGLLIVMTVPMVQDAT
jgi:hypothetical protein